MFEKVRKGREEDEGQEEVAEETGGGNGWGRATGGAL